MKELSLQEKAQYARTKHLEAVNFLKTVGITSFKLAEILHEIKSKKLYRYAIGEGTDTWYLYCENLGLSVSTADKLVDRYKTFVIRLKRPIEELAEINTINLQYILPIAKRAPQRIEELLEKAKALRSVDLMKDIIQEKLCEECQHKEFDIKVYCKTCREYFPEKANQLKKYLL